MCGIIGYVGHRDAGTLILEGLRRLEYRGYDSAGLAVIVDGQIALRRSAGKLTNLEAVLRREPVRGSTGVGHTRWATHGKPSDENAHPHLDCHGDIVVIHNGIVENYRVLKRALQSRGHTFRSETDTEVIVHLIEEGCQGGLSLADAMAWAAKEIRGAHAIVAMRRQEPDRLAAVKLGNAGGVVIGLGEGETFIASDMSALLEHTQRMLFLDSHELAVVSAEGAQVKNLDGKPMAKQVQVVNLDPIAAAKGGYKHFMLKEIYEQSRSLSDTLAGRLLLDPPGVYIEDFPFSDQQLREVQRLTLIGCGTAWHAALVGRFMIEELAGLPTDVEYSSEFRYRQPLFGPGQWVLAVTQSGETVDTLESMALARDHGSTLLAIVNVLGSQASRMADAVLYTHAGPEIGVASTKAFTAQLVALYLLAIRLGSARGTIDEERTRQLIQSLAELPLLVGQLLEQRGSYEELAARYFKHNQFLFIGRGVNYPIALEGALKLKEISYIHAEGYPAGEMKHGPIALIDEEMPVVAIATRDSLYSKIVSNIEQVKARGGIAIAVVNEGDKDLSTKVDHILPVPATIPLLSPILNVLPLQLLAYHVAVRRGCDVDQPRNLAKSVTVE
ncbi:MAG: glutamine--fructose-6-phosphate transaminase (isomerizing) [Chloroflexi bacterium]|nr:glutamine--fructose-6-phosphate transaminase (isomerizing) [Chloroflexota bacterium]